MRIDILSLFPEVFPAPLGASILGRAIAAQRLSVHVHDIRDHAENKHAKVDDRPFGGGPGMVLMCQPLLDAVRHVEALDQRRATRILFSPQGEPLRQPLVERLAREDRLLLIAAHYEGVDERVIELLRPLEVSVGDYVLSGGEIPALLLVDAVARLLPGSLGHEQSAGEDSFSPSGPGGLRLLDCPHYTRPRSFQGLDVPEVLLSGDHAAIARWRQEERLRRTRARRPDLLGEAGEGGGEEGSGGPREGTDHAGGPPGA
jgi:tRNA (guanine37-N1)-methyltransferase